VEAVTDKMPETTYITFGTDHNHTIGDKELNADTVASFKSLSYADGRDKALTLFGRQFCWQYQNKLPDDFSQYYTSIVNMDEDLV